MKSLRLKRDIALRIEDGAGTVVEVSQGEVWLTQERDPRDYHLRRGDWLRIERSGTAVVSPMGEEARIQLWPARRLEPVARMLAMLGLTRAAPSA